jgi:hypothetical protein
MGRAEIKHSRPPLGGRAARLLPRCAASIIPPLNHIAKLLDRRFVSGRAGLHRAAQGVPLLHGNVACKPIISAICHATVPYRG